MINWVQIMSKESKETKWRVHPYIRLVDFHKPLLSQMPVILFTCGVFVVLSIVLTLIYYGNTH
ncbi:MAG: hypothetical protein CMF96_07115 [Candidatus Marinimicrobia bacterium]|nr:hypothetical protein [Candidatus Neomarinimicrobiota bacterium]MAJ44498.1 hypothetical protein [Candidatus Neomarinimicrobiota bacterium]